MENNTLSTTRKYDIKIQSNQQNRQLDLFLSFVWNYSLENEEWKEIPDFDGRYYISNCGRILSLCNNGYKLLKPFICGSGYRYVDLRRDKQDVKSRVNRLVAQAFLTCENKDYEVHHKDSNKQNDTAQNLEYLSKKNHLQLHKRKL